jgi:hypothetical protein
LKHKISGRAKRIKELLKFFSKKYVIYSSFNTITHKAAMEIARLLIMSVSVACRNVHSKNVRTRIFIITLELRRRPARVVGNTVMQWQVADKTTPQLDVFYR